MYGNGSVGESTRSLVGTSLIVSTPMETKLAHVSEIEIRCIIKLISVYI